MHQKKMPQKMTMPNGREVNIQEVQFEIKNEDWNEYILLDGGRVRVKTVVQRIHRIVDDEGKSLKDAHGEPEIVVRHTSQVVSSDIN